MEKRNAKTQSWQDAAKWINAKYRAYNIYFGLAGGADAFLEPSFSLANRYPAFLASSSVMNFPRFVVP
jgi:hypothetical protein